MPRFFLIFIFVFFLSAIPLQAATVSDFTLTDAPSVNIRNRTFNTLVFDLKIRNVNNGQPDLLKAITLDQQGSARDLFDINALTLWKDAQETGFQGFGVDENLGNFQWNGLCDCYAFSGLSVAVPKDGVRLYVSVETANGATNGNKIQMRLLPLSDTDSDGVFDLGETGVFFESKNNGPTDALLDNPSYQQIVNVTGDLLAPLAVISSVVKNDSDGSFLVTGVAKDQGGSAVQRVQLGIDGTYVDVVPTGTNFLTWEYRISSLTAGTHTLTLEAYDFIGNHAVMARSVTLAVADAVKDPVISKTQSSVVFQGSVSPLLALVTVKDTDGASYEGAIIAVKTLSGTSVQLGSKTATVADANYEPKTDAAGAAEFRVFGSKNEKITIEILAVQTNGASVSLGSVTLNMSIDQDTPPEETKPVYLLYERTDINRRYVVIGNVYHLIPTDDIARSWGLDQKDFIKTTSFSSEWKSGSLIGFRPGTLIKGTEAAVSVVTSEGKRSWIQNEATYLGFGFQWNWIKNIEDSELALYPRAADITAMNLHPDGVLVRFGNSEKIYVMKAGKKRWISSYEVFLKNGFSGMPVISLNDSPERYSDGTALVADERFQ